MKKFISILVATVAMLSLCACTSSSHDFTNADYDGKIIEFAETMLEEFEPLKSVSLSVTKDSNAIYNFESNDGYSTSIQIQNSVPRQQPIRSNCKEYNSKVVDSAKSKIIDYINSSGILKDKEALVEYIINVPFKTADYENFSENTFAEYDLKTDTVFINNQNIEYVCEWGIVHELVHALCQKTNGGEENLRYPYALFNEVLTDMITASLKPTILQNITSGYLQYYDYVALYLGCFGMSGIEAYFYGYDDILAKIPAEELDLFVLALDHISYLESQQDSVHILSACINVWGSEKK